LKNEKDYLFAFSNLIPLMKETEALIPLTELCEFKDNEYKLHIIPNETSIIKAPIENKPALIIVKHSQKCLDISGANKENGGKLIQYNIHEGTN